MEAVSKYRIGNRTVLADGPDIQKLLAESYGKGGLRPVCLCRNPGIEMYVAKLGDKYVIKRMPDTGKQHDMTCSSYEHPAELSGLGEIMGTAIQENVNDGTTSLKFSFSLSKLTTGRAAPTAQSGKEADTVKSDEKKLTLRSTLDYLWEEAGFYKWSPGMANKRNWFVIRKYLLEAIQNKTAKGSPLANFLFIPEVFSMEHKDQIALRRTSHMSKLMNASGNTRKMMIVVGEVKEMLPARYGYKMIIKHLSDFPFMMPEDLYVRLTERFADELTLWDAVDNAHLIVIGRFALSPSGIPVIEELSFMLTSENWIPFENSFEKMLLDQLISDGRSFMKGLRYNLPSYRPIASVVLTDVDPQPVAMYIVPNESEEYAETLSQLMGDSDLTSWVWKPLEEIMPTIPPAKNRGNVANDTNF